MVRNTNTRFLRDIVSEAYYHDGGSGYNCSFVVYTVEQNASGILFCSSFYLDLFDTLGTCLFSQPEDERQLSLKRCKKCQKRPGIKKEVPVSVLPSHSSRH